MNLDSKLKPWKITFIKAKFNQYEGQTKLDNNASSNIIEKSEQNYIYASLTIFT